MADFKKLIEQIDQLGIEVNLSDLSSAHDLEKILSSISSLSQDTDIASLPPLAGALAQALSSLNSLKLFRDKKGLEEILSFLCSSLKAALSCLVRGEDPSEYIKSLEEKIKEISNPVGGRKIQTYFDSHLLEVPGFVSSAKGSIDDAEHCLLALEKSTEDKSKIDEVFRAFHTLKGEANLTGLSSIGTLAHEAEDFLGALRAGKIKADGEGISVLLRIVDEISRLLDQVLLDPSKAAGADVAVFVSELRSARARSNFRPQPPRLDLSGGADLYTDFISEVSDHLSNAEKSVLILESKPDDKEAINNIFRVFHTIKGAARFLDLKDIQIYAHEAETMLDLVRKGSLHFEGRVVELSLLSIDWIRKLLSLLQEQVANGGTLKTEYPDIAVYLAALKEVIATKKDCPIGEILVKQGVISDPQLAQALKIQKEATPDAKLGVILVATQSIMPKQIEEALESQRSGILLKASIRIQLDKLDALMDMVGELVITEAQVMQSPEMLAVKKEHFQRNLLQLDLITRNLQQLVMGMRLVSIGPVFQKIERLVRDLSKAMGKEVEVVLSGEDTEIDKNMAELIVDPLMHMVRNALDHGIEPKEERLRKAKSPVGKVELSAFHKGAYVVIEVKDDGGGLPREKILRKAVERGIIKDGTSLSDDRIFNLIFEPGFSTANIVTEVSGRGVGMDVVKRNVDRLHGKINVFSQEGQGTFFSIYFPITLAIVEGIVVKAGSQQYILPINSVIEFVRAKVSDLSEIYGEKQMYRVYDKVYPLVRLDDLFGGVEPKENFEKQTICILDSDAGRICVAVDELLGQQQVVIKSLGKKLENIRGVSGAAILGDGRVGLILDAGSLIELALSGQTVR